MDVRFVSSLTPADEDRAAATLLALAQVLLAQQPISYTLRIETSGGKVFQHSDAPALPPAEAVEAPRELAPAEVRFTACPPRRNGGRT